VRVASVAVLAGELAPAIRIDGPGKWHARYIAAIQQRPYGQGKEFDVVPRLNELPLRRHASDAHQRLWAR